MGKHCWATDLRVLVVASGSLFAVLVVAELARGPDDATGGRASDVRHLRDRDTARWTDFRAVACRLLTLAFWAVVAGCVIQAGTLAAGMRRAPEPNGEHLNYGEPADVGLGPGEPWEARLDRLVALKRQGTLLRRQGEEGKAERSS
jgi:hypothetical protein